MMKAFYLTQTSKSRCQRLISVTRISRAMEWSTSWKLSHRRRSEKQPSEWLFAQIYQTRMYFYVSPFLPQKVAFVGEWDYGDSNNHLRVHLSQPHLVSKGHHFEFLPTWNLISLFLFKVWVWATIRSSRSQTALGLSALWSKNLFISVFHCLLSGYSRWLFVREILYHSLLFIADLMLLCCFINFIQVSLADLISFLSS